MSSSISSTTSLINATGVGTSQPTSSCVWCAVVYQAFRRYWWQLPVREGSSWLEEPLQKAGTAPAGVLYTTASPCWCHLPASPCRCHSPVTPKTATSARLVTTVLRKPSGSACLLSKRQAKPFRINPRISHNGRYYERNYFNFGGPYF